MALSKLLILFIMSQIYCINSLECYSCSTLAGARHCTFDYFDASQVLKLECPQNANICSTLTVISGQSSGSVLRSCGIESESLNQTICTGGYFSPSGTCLTYKCTEGSFAGSSIQVCSCNKRFGNDNNIANC